MADTFEEAVQLRDSPKSVNVGDGDSDRASINHAERGPLAVSIRMIILLSLICWALLLAVVAWIVI